MSYRDGYTVAVLGATGAVGRAMLETLERRDFPVRELRALASPKSAGQQLTYKGETVTVEAVSEESFKGVDIALFSAGATTSLEWAPKAVEHGAVVIDNSSAYRMTEGVPLVVPEVNPHAAMAHKGIIANPNCSTIQLMVALSPLRSVGFDHVTISTYQAVSGMGQKAVDALKLEIERADKASTVFPVASSSSHYPMAFNVLPQCDVFVEDGYTKEEMKLVNESRKILELPELRVSPTAVRVPVVYGHSESVSVHFDRAVTASEVRGLLSAAPGVIVVDNPAEGQYPHPLMAAGTGDTYVGRIRRDLSDDRTVWMFIVADNLLKGAAWNAVQIAELLIKRQD
ncbi:aspartate-semialdehyde dehydrogenase [Alicyclobacillus curvatus]|jgi:aspartate-semialdehyde dehydrogenase|nr:aspartate-semialdehyde dehydrogenase [Alicyclobacillus curvatus]